jgi:hypothetical protein
MSDLMSYQIGTENIARPRIELPTPTLLPIDLSGRVKNLYNIVNKLNLKHVCHT